MEKQDLKALLEEAAKIPGVNVPIAAEEKPLEEKIVEITQYNLEDKWEIVKAAMEGEFADRFLHEMRALSGREFVRVYLKMLEYIKPKIVRVETEDKDEEDNIVRIEIFNSVPQVGEEVIDITEIQDENGTE